MTSLETPMRSNLQTERWRSEMKHGKFQKKKKKSFVLPIIAGLLCCVLAGGIGLHLSSNGETVELSDTAHQIQGLEDYTPSGSLSKSFCENVEYEVLKTKWNGKSGTAKVKVSTPDLERVISDSIQKAITKCGTDDYDKLLEEAKKNVENTLNSEDYSLLKSTIEMEVVQNQDGYALISNNEFERIISGSLEEIFINVLMEGHAK